MPRPGDSCRVPLKTDEATRPFGKVKLKKVCCHESPSNEIKVLTGKVKSRSRTVTFCVTAGFASLNEGFRSTILSSQSTLCSPTSAATIMDAIGLDTEAS